MVSPEKAAQFAAIAAELDTSIRDNCHSCRASMQESQQAAPQDPRRSRFLLRLVVSRVSHLFVGEKASMPRSLIEGLDRYLNKALGEIVYEQLNGEANQLLYNLNIDDDKQMWEGIRRVPQWRRFVDTIFIRILFRFENFPKCKRTFMNILAMTMEEKSCFTFTEEHFTLVFEALFSDLWGQMKNEETRIQWEFLFGDGTVKRISQILRQGLSRHLAKQKPGVGSEKS
jgi:hypothetical protein